MATEEPINSNLDANDTNDAADAADAYDVADATDAKSSTMDVDADTVQFRHSVVEPSDITLVDGPPNELDVKDESVHESANAVNIKGSGLAGLAALFPIAQTTPPLSQGVVSPRLVHFFCGLVYGEVRSVEFDEQIMFQLIKSTMELVESHASLSGKEKKELVVEVVRQVVLRKPMDEKLRDTCLNTLSGSAIREFINLVVAASKGELEINKVHEKRKSCQTCVIN